jgi:RNA polymerase-binding transcription factor DksA
LGEHAVAKRREESKAGTRPVARNKRPSGNNDPVRTARRRKASAETRRPADPIDASPVPKLGSPLPKTRLKPDELEFFKRLLLEKRRQLVGDVGHMEAGALNKNRTDAAGDLSMMPIHMADIGTDNYEQEFTIGLIENEQGILKEIDAALKRIKNESYGICEATRKSIPKARLKTIPWARYCVAYKRYQEENGR